MRVRVPTSSKVMLFDEQQGKIEGVCLPFIARRLTHGCRISYRLEPWKQLYRLDDVVLEALPASWASQDIFFLHHLLEMAGAFIQQEHRNSALFQLFLQLYEHLDVGHHDAQHHDESLFKKFFLGKFFALLGVYPEHEERAWQLFDLFASDKHESIATMERQELHEKLQKWLLACMQTHPRAHTFRTAHFVRMVV